jgi:hypothetical protein
MTRAFGRRSGFPRASNRVLVRSADAFQDLDRAPGLGQWASRTHLDPGVRSVRQGRARSEGRTAGYAVPGALARGIGTN